MRITVSDESASRPGPIPTHAARVLLVCMTPLGCPVVPEV